MNCPILAKLLVDSKELDEQDSKFACFRAKGIKEYWLTEEKLKKFRESLEEAGVESTVELTAKEATTVREGMVDSLSKPAKKPRTSKGSNVKEESPEQKELRTALALKGTALRKLKAFFEKGRTELTRHRAMLPLVLQKSYPAEMVAFMKAKLDFIDENVEAAATFFASEVIKPEVTDTEAATASTTLFDTKLKDLEKIVTGAKEGVFFDLKNLSK